jgi:hypothetical protein
MTTESVLKVAILNIINNDFKVARLAFSKVYSDEEIKIYIKKNSEVINSCIIDYIEDFGDDTKNIDEEWIREYLGEYCVN